MTQYNLNYKGSDVDLAIEKSLAHLNNIDTTPSSPSTKAVTSEGIKAALDGKLASSDIITNLNSPNNTTVPSTQAVANFKPNTPWYSAYKSFSGAVGASTLTGWGISSQENIGITESNGTFTLPTGHYQISVSLASGKNCRLKFYYKTTGGSYFNAGEMIIDYGVDNAGTSLVQIRGAGSLYCTVERIWGGPGSGSSTGYGAVHLSIFKLTDN